MIVSRYLALHHILDTRSVYNPLHARSTTRPETASIPSMTFCVSRNKGQCITIVHTEDLHNLVLGAHLYPGPVLCCSAHIQSYSQRHGSLAWTFSADKRRRFRGVSTADSL